MQRLRLTPILLAVMGLVAACGGSGVPTLDASYDGWCYTLDFTQPITEGTLSVVQGSRTTDGIEDVAGVLSLVYEHGSIVEPAVFTADVEVQNFDPNAAKTFSAEFNVFGFEEEEDGRVPASVSYGDTIGYRINAVGIAGRQARILVTSEAGLLVRIRSLTVAGNTSQDGPFPANNCAADPTATPTNDVIELPTATPSPFIPPTDVPPETATPTATPTVTPPPQPDFYYVDYGDVNVFVAQGPLAPFRDGNIWNGNVLPVDVIDSQNAVVGIDWGWSEASGISRTGYHFCKSGVCDDRGDVTTFNYISNGNNSVVPETDHYCTTIGTTDPVLRSQICSLTSASNEGFHQGGNILQDLLDDTVTIENYGFAGFTRVSPAAFKWSTSFQGQVRTHVYGLVMYGVPQATCSDETPTPTPQGDSGDDISISPGLPPCDPTATPEATVTATITDTPALTATAIATGTSTQTITPQPTGTANITATVIASQTPLPSSTADSGGGGSTPPPNTPDNGGGGGATQDPIFNTPPPSFDGDGGDSGDVGIGINDDSIPGNAAWDGIRNFFGQAQNWARLGQNLSTRFRDNWRNAPPIQPQGLFDCVNRPLESNVCAVYYILENTLFARTGTIIIPLMTVFIDLMILIQVMRYVRTFLGLTESELQ